VSDPIRLDETPTSMRMAELPAPVRRLIVFTRIVALLWLAKGLWHFSTIVGLGEAQPTRFESLSLTGKTVIGYLATIDTIAAIGLWFGAVWGGLIWLFAGVTLIGLAAALPDYAGLPVAAVAPVVAGLAILYLWLLFVVSRSRGGPRN
jgi:hypothetical protein